MAGSKSRDAGDLRDAIQRLDALCRESERVRRYAEQAMKRRQSWPERRWSRSWDDSPVAPGDSFNGDDAA